MPKKKQNKLTIKLSGSDKDDGFVRLNEFAEFIKILQSSLSKIDNSLSGEEKKSTYYRITNLKSSRATVTFEAVPTGKDTVITDQIIPVFLDSIDKIQNKCQLPSHLELSHLEYFKGLGKLLNKHVKYIEIENGNKHIDITSQLNASIEKILGKDITSKGSITGFLDIINVHSSVHSKKVFWIYPVIGPQKIECFFNHDELFEKVKEGIERYVNVMGTISYRGKDLCPYKIQVEDIEVYPPKEELPGLLELKGIAPELVGGKDAVTFIREIRDAEEEK